MRRRARPGHSGPGAARRAAQVDVPYLGLALLVFQWSSTRTQRGRLPARGSRARREGAPGASRAAWRPAPERRVQVGRDGEHGASNVLGRKAVGLGHGGQQLAGGVQDASAVLLDVVAPRIPRQAMLPPFLRPVSATGAGQNKTSVGRLVTLVWLVSICSISARSTRVDPSRASCHHPRPGDKSNQNTRRQTARGQERCRGQGHRSIVRYADDGIPACRARSSPLTRAGHDSTEAENCQNRGRGPGGSRYGSRARRGQAGRGRDGAAWPSGAAPYRAATWAA